MSKNIHVLLILVALCPYRPLLKSISLLVRRLIFKTLTTWWCLWPERWFLKLTHLLLHQTIFREFVLKNHVDIIRHMSQLTKFLKYLVVR